jgi:hypothetical protein
MKPTDPKLKALEAVLDAQSGRYDMLRHVSTFAEYIHAKGDRADEEILTEPVLAAILEQVLGFPADQYVPQYSRGCPKSRRTLNGGPPALSGRVVTVTGV